MKEALKNLIDDKYAASSHAFVSRRKLYDEFGNGESLKKFYSLLISVFGLPKASYSFGKFCLGYELMDKENIVLFEFARENKIWLQTLFVPDAEGSTPYELYQIYLLTEPYLTEKKFKLSLRCLLGLKRGGKYPIKLKPEAQRQREMLECVACHRGYHAEHEF